MWTHGTLRTVRTWVGLSVAAAGDACVLTLPFLFPYQRRAAALWLRAAVRRGRAVLGQRLVLHHRVGEPDALGRALRFYPHGRRGNIPGIRPVAARDRGRWLAWCDRHLRRTSSVPSVLAVASPYCHVAPAAGVVDATDRGHQRRAVWRLRCHRLGHDHQRAHAAAPGDAVRWWRSACCSPSRRARAVEGARSCARRSLRLAIDRARDVAVARPDAKCRRVTRLGLWPLRLLYDYVPGFNGVRVPARYAMIAGLFLAVLAGYGARVLSQALKLSALDCCCRVLRCPDPG